MPSTYAHYRLGKEVALSLPEGLRNIINKHIELYDIGLHGPDILFYYKPYFANRVNQTGFGMHEEPGKYFFEGAGNIIRAKEKKEAHLAYIFGFICHFVLDSQCHGYIDEKIERSGVTHTEIEAEFDRELLQRDGYNPISKSLTEHILPSERSGKVISEFFQDVTAEEIILSLESMKHCNQMLLAPRLYKRLVIYGILAVTGNYKEMHGLVINRKPNLNCEDSTEMLKRLYVTAVGESIRLITEYADYIRQKQPLDNRYRLTFGSKDEAMLKEERLA